MATGGESPPGTRGTGRVSPPTARPPAGLELKEPKGRMGQVEL